MLGRLTFKGAVKPPKTREQPRLQALCIGTLVAACGVFLCECGQPWSEPHSPDIKPQSPSAMKPTKAKTQTNQDLHCCPFGHTTLKQVPIIYGLLKQSPELEREIKNLEIWPGGCCVRDEETKTVCTKCMYAYDSISRYWEKSSENPSHFGKPLSRLIANFPQKQAQYYQDIKDGAVYRESVYFWTAEEPSALHLKLVQYLKGYGIIPGESTQTFKDRQYRTMEGKLNDKYCKVELMYETDMKETSVSCELGSTRI